MLKRTVAGLLAAGLLVSSVGIDDIIADLSGIMMTSVAVDVASKQGSSIGFGSLEKDTDGTGDSKIYNTNYGLHTDKTVAQAYPDGRTFDLDLESWYIGEKPADVGMVLDASGSMAWPIDPLDPLTVEEKWWNDVKDNPTYVNQDTGFLTTEGEAEVLESTYTDNSRLSYADYQYYIYDSKAANDEFIPLGYWDGKLITETVDPIEELKETWSGKGLTGYYPFLSGQVAKNQVSEYGELSSSETIGVSSTAYTDGDGGNSKALKIGKNNCSLKLDVSPTIKNDGSRDYCEFTIAFALDNTIVSQITGSNYLDILSFSSNDNYIYYLREKEDGKLSMRTTRSVATGNPHDDGGSKNGLSNTVLNNKYSFFTLTFYDIGDDKLYYKLYKDGTQIKLDGDNDVNVDSYSNILTKDASGSYLPINIILNPKKTSEKNIYLDEVYFFDTALSESDVKKLSDNAKKQKVQTTTEILTDRAIVPDSEVIAYINGALSKVENEAARKGWYYVNSHSTWKVINNEEIATGKELKPLIKEDQITDLSDNETKSKYIDHIAETVTRPKSDKDSNNDDWYFPNNSTVQTSIKEILNGDSPTTTCKFFVDENYHLRCFFNTGSATKPTDIENGKGYNTQCSLVYKKDKQLIKTEALNNALQEFIQGLTATSQQSNISAVRFSTNNMFGSDFLGSDKRQEYKDGEMNETGKAELDKLVLLNWLNGENGAGDIEDLAASRFGDKTTATGNDRKKTEYNYFLTGGTYTWTGLASFYYNLASDKDISSTANPKYLILFTDGKDNDVEATFDSTGEKITSLSGCEKAEYWAKKLKDEEGYQIYCILLSGGSVSEDKNPQEYQKVMKFLKEYVATDDSYVYDASSSEALNSAFTSILNQIKKPLTNYTVQDYIDPRFDLIDYTTDKENGTVLHLGAGGKVSGKTLTDAYAAAPTSCDYTTKDGKTAKLYYDSAKDMYYLRWTEVAIPGFTSPFEGTKEEFDVWSSTITVKAKDDFIGGNAVLTNGNEAGMNLVFNEHSIKDETDKKAALTDLSGTDKADDGPSTPRDDGFYPSKGFPRTTVNVRLLDIETKDLNDVIYLGEVVSPTIMLADLENDYLTGSYYLEYLERYAYRLYGASAESTPLIELLNKWLQIYNYDVNVKSFTIPYIYLPDPKYDGNKIEMVGDKPVVENNAGTSLNQLDILGYLTYTWEKVGELEDGQTLVTDEFLVKKPGQIKYQLSLEYTPLHEDTISSPSFTSPLVGAQFIPDDEVFFAPSGENFNISADKNNISTNYGNVTVDTDTKWTFTNRQDYLKALVNENKDGNVVYEWDKDYKPTKGREQIERAHQYGDATKENDFYTLTANTIYTKDVVNAALALKLIVKGSDLKGGNIAANKTYTFTAKRNYKDELDPVYYKDSSDLLYNMNANATNEEYTLTFTVGKIPAVTNVGEYYTIWATLSDIKKDEDGTTLDSLPIGTYKITADMSSTDFVVKKDSGTGSDVYFDHLITDTDPANYKQELFPEAVTKESDSHKVYNNEYTIYDGTNDRSGENIANTKEENGTDSERTVTFYFGTKNDDGERGTRKVEDPDTKEEYVKDRLGIIVLSYGSGQLSISKEVTDTKEKANLDNEWVFDVTITSNEDMAGHGYYTLSWTDLEGNPLEGREPKTITFTNKTDNTYTAKINIKSGEKVTIEQLPDDAKYTVSETRSEQKDGFTDDYKYRTFVGNTSYETYSASGTAAPDTHVHFINQFPSAELPSAGGSGVKWYIIIGSALTVFSGVMYLYLYRRRKPAFKAHRRI